MWLLRGLSFTCKALQNSQSNKTQELSTSFNASYDVTLKKFHTIFIRPVFTVSYIGSPCFFFSIAIARHPRLSEVEQAGGNEPKFFHICGSAATFFFSWLHSGCRVFDVADAILLNLI